MKTSVVAGVRRATVVGGTLVLLGGGTACDDNALEPPRECAGPIALVVSSSTPPQFSWTLPCAVARVVVLEPPVQGTSAVAWDVRSAPPRIVSPVRYGDRPSGATEEEAPSALRSGDKYQVRVYSDAQIVIGSASFIP
jgi:hypothetical protein